MHMKGFKVPCVFFISSFRYHVIPKRLLLFRSIQNVFFYFHMTGDRNSHAIPFFPLVVIFLADSSLSEAIVLYDRQCKIKRCPQNGLTAYTIVIYVWPSEHFCGQSGHKNFQGGVILICRKLILKQISTKKEINALRSIVEARIFIPRFLRILSSKQE